MSEKQNAKLLGSAYRDPLITFYPNSNKFLTKLYEDRLQGRQNDQWPSEAPSSIAVYTASAIPGWRNSLLMSTLKGNKLIRLKLNNSGDGIVGDTICYFKNKLRYRDIALSPDGKKIYLAVDSTSQSSNPAKQNPEQILHPGSIIEFTYVGSAVSEMDNKRR